MELTITTKETSISFGLIDMSYINIVLNKMYGITMYYGDEREFNREQLDSMVRYLLKNKESFSSSRLLNDTVEKLNMIIKTMAQYEKATFKYC